MPAIPNSSIIPFNPLGNPLGTILTTTQLYNRGFKRIKRGSAMSPYPNPATIYHRSVISDPGDDMFANVYMSDMYSFFFSFLLWIY
jgi:hypothetical protein